MIRSTVIAALSALLLALSPLAHAETDQAEDAAWVPETWEVSPTMQHAPRYRDLRKIIIDAIKEHPEWSVEQRIAFYDTEIGKLQAKFREERTAEYESKSWAGSVSHSCTSQSSGGVKKCGWRCVNSPSPDLYTQRPWVIASGDNKGIRASSGQACLNMTVAGKGRNAGKITATFRYKPESIVSLVNHQTTELFGVIADATAADVSTYVDERADSVDTVETYGEE